jgi:hypothetical protein
MTKEEALAFDLALDALEKLTDTEQTYEALDLGDKAITAIKQARSAPVQEPVAWVLLREDEDGFEPIQFYGGKEKPETAAGELKPRFTLRPVCFADTTPPAAPAPAHTVKIKGFDEYGPLLEWSEHWVNFPVGTKFFATPPAQPAVQEPVAFEVGLVEWVGNKLMATPKVTTTPPASWMEMVTANLVREGINKHKARELAEHFYGLAQRQWVGLTDEEVRKINQEVWGYVSADHTRMRGYAQAIEAKLRSKNNG